MGEHMITLLQPHSLNTPKPHGLDVLCEAYEANASLNLSGIAYENNHTPVFHAWLYLDRESRRQALRDRYVFFSVMLCVHSHLFNLLKLDFAKANEFAAETMDAISYLAQGNIEYSEEWFRGIETIAGTFTDHNYLPEARSTIALGFRTGVVKFPGLAQSLTVHAAYLDALAGRREKAAKVALRLLKKPFLLPNRRELPKLYQKLMYVLSASNHLDEYKFILWKGVSSLHADGALRDTFVGQIVTTYRGAFRALLHRNVPLAYRLPFLLGNLARIIAGNRSLAQIRVHLPVRRLHGISLYLLDYITFRKPIASRVIVRSSGAIGSDVGGLFPLLHRGVNRRILVTRAMGGIGDLLTMTPGLKALAIKYPNAQIDFAIPKPFHPIFENFQEVRLLDINEDDIDLSRYHRWINLTDCPAGRTESRQYPNVRSNRIAVFARAMGIRKWRLRWSVGFKPVYRVKPEEISWAEEYLADINPRGLPVIGVQPLAADTYKNWSHMEMLVRQLSTDHLVLVFHHREINGFAFDNVIKVRETFRRCAALVGQCSRMVVVDSSFLHLSGALGIPTIALFFATSGRVVTRYYPNVRICTPEKSDFPCYPCWRNEHKPCHLTNGRESICARSITVEQVMGALTTDVEHWRVKPNPLARLKTWILYGRE
jgi:ADP-heptose:LPS heptosyltransferase